MDIGNLIAVCDSKPWLGNYREYPDYDYPYTFEEVEDLKTLAERFDFGNWSVRTGLLYGGLAFVQQSSGGDDWLTLQQIAPGEWKSFESISMRQILRGRGQDAFEAYVNRLVAEHRLKLPINEIHTSPDFQCDVTDGYPTVLCYDLVDNQAWLEPSPAFDDEDDPMCRKCMEACDAWGVRPCFSWVGFNVHLESLGEEAYENAAVEIEDQGFGGMGGIS